jgi:hypothetical protein
MSQYPVLRLSQPFSSTQSFLYCSCQRLGRGCDLRLCPPRRQPPYFSMDTGSASSIIASTWGESSLAPWILPHDLVAFLILVTIIPRHAHLSCQKGIFSAARTHNFDVCALNLHSYTTPHLSLSKYCKWLLPPCPATLPMPPPSHLHLHNQSKDFPFGRPRSKVMPSVSVRGHRPSVSGLRIKAWTY